MLIFMLMVVEVKKPIHLAAYGGHKYILDLFLRKEVSIEGTDRNGLTPLHYVAPFDHIDLTKILCNKWADIHAKTIKGQKSIHLSAHGGYKILIITFVEIKLKLSMKYFCLYLFPHECWKIVNI